MFSIPNGAQWHRAFDKRVTRAEFAGVPLPSFFICANREDNAAGKVVDVISGTQASFIGGSGFGLDGDMVGSRALKGLGIPYIDLSGNRGLDFGNLPAFSGGGSKSVFISCLFAGPRFQGVSGGVGLPLYSNRTLIARSLRNPGGTHTNLSGWKIGLQRRKLTTGTAGYAEMCILFKAACSSSTYWMNDAPGAAPVTGSSIWPPAGSDNNTFLRELALVVSSLGRGYTYDNLMNNMLNSMRDVLTPGAQFLGGTAPARFINVVNDTGDRPFLVGCSRDENTDTAYTDFLDGRLVMLSVWFGPAAERVGALMNGGQRPMFLPGGNPYSLLQSIANNRFQKGILELPKRSKVDYYLGTTQVTPAQVVTTGSTVGKYQLVSILGSLYRALNAGVITGSIRDRRTPHFVDFGSVIGAADSTVFSLVSGTSEDSPANSASLLSNACDGDTITIMPSYAVSPYEPLIFSRAAYDTSLSLHLKGMAAHGRPVKLLFDSDSTTTEATVECKLYSGSYLICNQKMDYRNIKIYAGTSKLVIAGVNGNYRGLMAVGVGAIEIFHSTIRSNTSWAVKAGYGSTFGTPPIYQSGNVQTSAFAGQVTTATGLVVFMYGGMLSGITGYLAEPVYGDSIKLYGVQQRHRYINTERNTAQTETDAFASAPGKWNYVITGSRRGGTKFSSVGGAAGIPYYVTKSDNRTSPTRVTVDNLRAKGSFWKKNISYSGDSTQTDPMIEYGIYRKASASRLEGSKFSFRVPGASRTPPPRLFSPIALSTYNSSAVATKVRMYLYGYYSLSMVNPEITIRYRSSTGVQKVWKSWMASITLQSVANTLWQSTLGGGLAYYFDITLPSLGVGEVKADIYAIYHVGSASQGQDAYLDATLDFL